MKTSQISDRVRRHTAEPTMRDIDESTKLQVAGHAASRDAINQRLRELEAEWDVERTLELNASTLALTGAALGMAFSKKWFILTGAVLGFLFQHGTSGWCPPLPVLRKLGIRTQGEVDQERFALKAIRGDFDAKKMRRDPDSITSAVSQSERLHDGAREPDRVRRYTANSRLAEIDEAMLERVRLYARQPADVIGKRIRELEREWSVERYLQVNVAVVGLSTAALAVTRDRRWGYATCAGLAMFLFHAVEGFDPPLPLLRKLGRRSRTEINREIYALKILRGDFDRAMKLSGTGDAEKRIEAALEAVGL